MNACEKAYCRWGIELGPEKMKAATPWEVFQAGWKARVVDVGHSIPSFCDIDKGNNKHGQSY